VTLAEHGELGGACLNVGCIPTKALLHVGEFYHKIKTGSVAGIKADASVDWPDVQRHKEKIVGQLTGGVNALLRHNGVRVLREKAFPLKDRKVKIGPEKIEADAIILATGSVGTKLNFPGADLPGVIDSDAALSFPQIPKSVIIVGGGVIGVEFATLFNWLGTKVTILEMLPDILPMFDAEISACLNEKLKADGVRIHTAAELTSVTKEPAGLTACFKQKGAQHRVCADYVLVAVGRRPNTADLGLEDIGVKLVKGAIKTDVFFRTDSPGIYAIGDCNGMNMLAHAAMAQGEAAVQHIMGAPVHYNPNTVPGCVYSSPEIAAVGMTEKQVIDAGIDYSTGLFSLGNNGKSLIDDVGGGFVKIIADKQLGEVLGVHIIGSKATEMIGEAVLCMSMEGTVEDIANSIHAHPTVSEAIGEAAMSVFGKPIHGM
jgi:dihydrolipoamide dehydrogenase